MIIYGSKAVHLQTARTETVCQSCQTKGSILLSVYRKHAHIFWIPTFPIGKKGFSQCEHCKNILEEKEMSPELKKECDKLKKESNGPFWQWIGSLLFAYPIINSIIYAITGK